MLGPVHQATPSDNIGSRVTYHPSKKSHAIMRHAICSDTGVTSGCTKISHSRRFFSHANLSKQNTKSPARRKSIAPPIRFPPNQSHLDQKGAIEAPHQSI